ncbi:MAG: hypothetical protein UY95_C0013G0003 [Parcubacteria group bacterium GW2011_GWA2_56_7]|nr:MAG: hypothetical protein UY95_C0013G0003 [Parcubacteria group bacterium GW2011_GWA2_56_7]
MPNITVKVDKDLCIGAASCVTIDPATFGLDDGNIAYVMDHAAEPDGRRYERVFDVTDDELQNILLAAQSCPTLAITILDQHGTQLFPEL